MRRITSIGIVCLLVVGNLLSVTIILSDNTQGLNWNSEVVDFEYNVGTFSSIAVDGNNYPHIAYIDRDHLDLMYSKWTGSAWVKETVDMGDIIEYYTSISIDSNGWPHIIYVDSEGYKYAKWDGSAWDKTTVYNYVPNTDPPLTLGWHYDEYFFFLDQDDYGHFIFENTYKYWDSNGFHQTEIPINVSSRNQFTYHNHLFQISHQSDEYEDLIYYTWNGTEWNETVVDSWGKVGSSSSIFLDSNNYPHIIYSNDSSGESKIAKWDGTKWNLSPYDFDTGIIYDGHISTEYNNGDFSIYMFIKVGDVTISPKPEWGPYWGEYDIYNVMKKTLNNGNWNSETIYDKGDLIFPSMVKDSDGFYHISYYDYDNNALNYSKSLLPVEPSKPENLTASVGSDYINLNWASPNDDGGKEITNYKIYRGTTTGSLSLLSTIGTVLYFNDTGVTFNQTYFYQISAVNSIGEGSLSDETNATLVSPIYLPSAPLNLQATAGYGQIILDWSLPSSDGGSNITNYKIYRGTTSNGETLLITLGNVLTYIDTSVTNGQTYYYKVGAVNSKGEGAKSNEASAIPSSEVTIPSAPLNLQATPGNGKIILDWSPPSSNGGAVITNYKIYRGTTSGSLILLTTIGNVSTYTDNFTLNDQTYFYKVSAVNSVGEGTESSEVSATPTTEIAIPSAPVNLQSTAGDGQVTLTWAIPSTDGGSSITNYMIYRGTTTGGETLLATIGNVQTYADSSVTNNQTYYYKITAVNSIGEGAYSNEITATPNTTIDDDSTDIGDDNASSILFPIIALIIIIAAIGGVIFALKRKPKNSEPSTGENQSPPPEKR